MRLCLTLACVGAGDLTGSLDLHSQSVPKTWESFCHWRYSFPIFFLKVLEYLFTSLSLYCSLIGLGYFKSFEAKNHILWMAICLCGLRVRQNCGWAWRYVLVPQLGQILSAITFLLKPVVVWLWSTVPTQSWPTTVCLSLYSYRQSPKQVACTWYVCSRQLVLQPRGGSGWPCMPLLTMLELTVFLAAALLLGSVAVFPSEPCQEHFCLKKKKKISNLFYFILWDLVKLKIYLPNAFRCLWKIYDYIFLSIYIYLLWFLRLVVWMKMTLIGS